MWGTADKGSDGFVQKLLIAVLGLVFAASLAFFSWMALAVIDIRERVIAIETTARALTEARTRETQHKIERTAERVEELEKE
jgi:hypothetical protein